MADKQDKSAFIGVSPEYQNYGIEQFKPLYSGDADTKKAEQEAQKAAEDSVVKDEKSADEKPADEKPEDEKPADEKPEDEKPEDEKPASPARTTTKAAK